MRRFVRYRVIAALERARPALEEYVSEQLIYPEGVPYVFSGPVVMIRDVRKVKIVPLARADHPPVQVHVLLKAWLAHRAVQIRVDWDPGVLDADVQLTAYGNVTPDGTYTIAPQSATLKAWWRDVVLVEPQAPPTP